MENIQEFREEPVYFWQTITPRDKALLYEHLANMIDWWVTVISALNAFLEKTLNPKLAREVSNLLIFIDSWDSFSIAMKKLPLVFNKKEIAIIEAWESSGTMQKSFESLGSQLREQEDLKMKAKAALTYPIIIVAFLIVAVFVIMTLVIPKLEPLFETTQVELPFATKSLIAVSHFLSSNFILLLIWAILVAVWIKTYSKTDEWRRYFDELFLKMPLLWSVYKNYIIAQIASNLWLLIWAWIPIIKTLRLTWEASNNVIYDQALRIISEKVAGWKKLTHSIEETDPNHICFPNDFIQIIWAWEKTSTVNKVCEKIHKQYTREVEYSITVMIKWIEPLAVLIAWIFVLWFAFAIFAAVLKITETVS
ncbi:MAG: hypothetical protein ACD_2C00038G0010 [uncultured bacterium (gcode 4)]|uniref:Type II secretion system protein GspF domain-containing protein n=1 Tax=uncultured bacterium (gcode 4) TaxID=1234023 RepID=K2G4I2_9BACT|nr:MAG: hypothetical protein ACD_2C00038G0010 [uncultured bacterium (gcode 4)]